jgi:hypothetical protein
MKLAVDSRSSLPLKLLRQRRQDAKGKRRLDKVEDGNEKVTVGVLPIIEEPAAFGQVLFASRYAALMSRFDVDSQDLKDLFILSK